MAELEALQEILGAFEARGATVVAACPQLLEHSVAMRVETGRGFPLVQDVGNRAARAFGLAVPTPPDVRAAEEFLGLDLPTFTGTSDWDLPLPARYVIGRDGRILFRSVHADHTRRSEPVEALIALG